MAKGLKNMSSDIHILDIALSVYRWRTMVLMTTFEKRVSFWLLLKRQKLFRPRNYHKIDIFLIRKRFRVASFTLSFLCNIKKHAHVYFRL